MIVLGLTGGIGMGKSTAARHFRALGIPVFDADAEVRRLQAPGGPALPAIARAFPGTVHANRLDRARLREIVLADAAARRTLEAILHPMVRQAERRFRARAQGAGQRLIVLDLPLLFETGAERRVDHVIAVSAPRAVQLARLRLRGTMPDAHIARMIAAQLPDQIRVRRAGTVIKTGLSRRHTQARIARLVQSLRAA